MPDPFKIYVNNVTGDDIRNSGLRENQPVQTADTAFNLVPEQWRVPVEIIFFPTGEPYRIATDTIYLGTPIGTEAASLVIRAHGTNERDRYRRIIELTAISGTANDLLFRSEFAEDALLGATIGRVS